MGKKLIPDEIRENVSAIVEKFNQQELRNVDKITSPTMHHSFRPPLPDLKSQKYQNSPLFHQLL
jgi:hypothetical protein